MSEILLTIGIPTYKREKLLDICLDHFISQITDDIRPRIEIIVSDNASPDDTKGVVDKYIAAGFPIRYLKNEENLGPDKNIAACFLKATGKYMWVFSDDDFILPNRFRQIFDLLESKDFGNIFINTLSYLGEPENVVQAPDDFKFTEYTDPVEFVERVNYWSTFITGNIVNKSLFGDYEYINDFYNTFLVQLSWILPSIFAGKSNIVIDSQMVACLANNTGGYKLYEVFGKNYNWVLDQFIKKELINKKSKRVTNKHLVKSFFPMFLHTTMLQTSNALRVMIPIYWSYPAFWTKIFPTLLKRQIKGNG